MSTLTTRARHGDLVLLVDDVNQLDDASAVVVSQLVHVEDLVVVMAARSTEDLPPDLARLSEGHASEVVELGPLSRAENDQLVRFDLAQHHDAPVQKGRGAVVAEDALAEIWAWSHGVPFHTRDLVNAAVVSGALQRRSDGEWVQAGALAPSSRFSDELGRRVERLGSDCERLVRVLAVAGALPFGLADRVATPEQRLAAERSGILRRPGGGDGPRAEKVEFAHDLYREAALSWMSAGQRRELAAGAAALFDQLTAPTPEEELQRAELSLAAGDLGSDDPAVYERGAEVACRVSNDGERGLRLAEAAIARGAGWTAELLRLSALGLLGRFDEASKGFVELAVRMEDPLATAVVSVARAWHLLFEVGDGEQAVEVLSQAARGAPEGLVEELEGQQLTALVYCGRYADAVRTGEKYVRAGDAPPTMAFGLVSALAITGRPGDALRLADASLAAIADAEPDAAVARVTMVWNRLLASWQLGRLGELDGPFEGIDSDVGPILGADWATDAMWATFHIVRGQLERGCGLYDEVWPQVLSGPTQAAAFNLVLRVMGEAQLGRPEVARRLLSRLDSFPPGATQMFSWWVERSRLLALAAEGQVAEAARQSIELAGRRAEERFHATTSLHDVVRLGRPKSVREALAAQAGRDGATWWDELCADHAAAAAEEDGPALMAVAERFERGGRAADAFAALALVVDLGARVGAGSEDRVLGSVAHARLDDLRAVCGPVFTPLGEVPFALTERERVVARLAAAGMSNGDIAERLGTSVRTVGNQLQQVYQKLGVHSRKDLRVLVE